MEDLVTNENIAIGVMASVILFLSVMLFKIIGFWREDAKETRDVLSEVNQTLSRLTTLIEVKNAS